MASSFLIWLEWAHLILLVADYVQSLHFAQISRRRIASWKIVSPISLHQAVSITPPLMQCNATRLSRRYKSCKANMLTWDYDVQYIVRSLKLSYTEFLALGSFMYWWNLDVCLQTSRAAEELCVIAAHLLWQHANCSLLSHMHPTPQAKPQSVEAERGQFAGNCLISIN